MRLIATVATFAFIVLLFRLARERNARTSWAVLIPILWFGIVCSRHPTQWLQLNQSTDYMARYTESSPVDASAYGLMVAAGLLVLNRRAQRVKLLLRANLPVVLFFFYTALSLSWSDSPAIAAKRWIKAIGDLVMVLVVLSEEDHEAAIRRMYRAVASIVLPLSVLFILYYPGLGTLYDPIDKVTMYTGAATFKNLLGETCMACGLGALWSLIAAWHPPADTDRKRHLFVDGVNLLLAVGLVLRADSMTSFSALALAGMMMASSSFRWAERRPLVIAGMIAGVAGIAGFALFLDTSGGMLHELGRNATLTGRTTIWRAVLAQKINPVLGAGFESFWMGDRMQSVWSMSQVGIQEAHDGYLELYLNLGWVGLALLGAMIAFGYRNGIALYLRDPDAGRLRLGLLTAAVVFAFTEAGFGMLSPDWIGFLLGVMALPVSPEPGRLAQRNLAAGRKEKGREVRVLY